MTQPLWFRVRASRDLGFAVRTLRELHGETQTELAERLGSSRSSISRLEGGSDVGTHLLLAAVQAFGQELIIVPHGSRITVEDES